VENAVCEWQADSAGGASMLYTEDHTRLMASIRRFLASEIDPYVDE